MTAALASTDPTGLSSSTGQLVIAAGLAAALVLAIRAWLRQRGR